MAVQKFLSLRPFTLALALATASTCLADITLTPVALSRDKFPARGSNLRQGSFAAPGINIRGTVVYYATCYGSGVTAASNTFIGRVPKKGKNGRIIAREGGTVAVGGFNYPITKLFGYPHVNSQSRVSWGANINDGTANIYIFYTNQKGSYGLYGFLSNAEDDSGVDLNSRGAIVIRALAPIPDNPEGIIRATPKASFTIVAVGETAVGLPLGSEFTEFGDPTISDNNYVAFSAKVSDTDNKFDGIWYGKNGDPDPLVVNGDTIPDVGTISAFGDLTILSSSGKLISFVATTESRTGIFVLDTTTKKIRLVAHNGESVDDFTGTLSAIQPGAVNNRGQVAFGIKSSGEAALSEDLDRVNALFFAQPSSAPKKVIANGDTVVVKGKSRRVIDIRFAPTRGLNDLGYLAFTASFSDRTSGVFVVRP